MASSRALQCAEVDQVKKTPGGLWIWGAVLLGLHAPLATAAGNFYKWVDEKGVIHYGDRIPPEYSQQERAVINKNGITVEVTTAAKTKEQLADEEREARVQAEQRRKTEEQAARDRVLLGSYANEDDLVMTRDGKIAALDAIVRITTTNIATLQRALADMTAQAAEKERSGQPVPASLRRDITSAQELITKHRSYIDSKRKEQEEVHARFDADLKRFRELKAILVVENHHQESTPPKKDNEALALIAKEGQSVVAVCKDLAACDRAWSLAQLYVRAKANTRIQIVTDTLIVTNDPTRPDAIGLSVAKVPDQGGTRLVMDTLCHNSPEGQEYCHTLPVQAVRDGFKGYVEAH
jgi:hypothetical protein